MKIPEEAYSSKRPDVCHFMIFGSSVYFHVTKDAWKNIEMTTKLGIIVGYTDTPHNYWVYLLTNRMTVVRRDVRFDEQKATQVSIKREIQLHAVQEILVPKIEEPQIDVEQPHAKDPGVETSTQAESSREADKLMYDARDNVGEPTS